LIFLLQNEHLPTCSNFTWLHVDLQPVRVCSIALAVAFSEQMYQVASTPPIPRIVMSAGQAVEHLLEQRERYGFSYIPVYGGAQMENFAPVVAQLAGT
jgi:hypothetical protein